MSIDEEEWDEIEHEHSTENKSYDLYQITDLIKDALELAREKDEPRDMQIRFLLSIAVKELESLRYENSDYFATI